MDDDRLTLLRRRSLGMVFQAFNLVDVLTAVENVALPLVIDGVRESEADRRAREALARVGLSERAEHLPGQLSGGEQQRVAIARALVIKPVILLADELTGNLDSATGDELLHLLRRLVDEQKQTLLLVTHDARHAAWADRLLRLRDGKFVEEQKLRRRGGRCARCWGSSPRKTMRETPRMKNRRPTRPPVRFSSIPQRRTPVKSTTMRWPSSTHSWRTRRSSARRTTGRS